MILLKDTFGHAFHFGIGIVEKSFVRTAILIQPRFTIHKGLSIASATATAE